MIPENTKTPQAVADGDCAPMTCYPVDRSLQVKRYTNPTTLRGVKPVRMRLRNYSLLTTRENVKGENHKEIAKKYAEDFNADVVYRQIRGSFGTVDVEIWIKHETPSL